MTSINVVPTTIAGYQVLSLSLPPLPALPQPATHYLYVASHVPKVPTASAVRSLFVINVPFDAAIAHIKHLFSTQLGLSHGRIEDVRFASEKKQVLGHEELASQTSTEKRGKKRKRLSHMGPIEELEGAALPHCWDRDLQLNGGTAVIIFVDRASMDAALKAVKKAQKNSIRIIWGDGLGDAVPELGSASWHPFALDAATPLIYVGYFHHHRLRYPNKAQLLESVNSYMTAFTERETLQAKMQAKRRQIPDDEGFITVTRGARNGPAKQEAVQEQASKLKERQKGLDDFYRFQMRERRKAKAGELARKFEEDTDKVKRMREQRGKFKVGYGNL